MEGKKGENSFPYSLCFVISLLFINVVVLGERTGKDYGLEASEQNMNS